MSTSISVQQEQIECIVKKQGLEFVIIKQTLSIEEFEKLRLNPNVVYYISSEDLNFCINDKAILLFHGRQYSIIDNEISAPSIRKWLNGDKDRICNICYQYNYECAHCACCGFKWCPICVVKIIFNKYDEKWWNKIDFTYIQELRFPMNCPQCKKANSIDLLQLYFRVIHKLNCFTNDQQTILRLVADKDPHFLFKMELRKKAMKNLNVKLEENKHNGHQQPSQPIKNREKPNKKKKRNKKQNGSGWKKGFLL